MEPGPIRFSELHAELYPDCRRIHVTVTTEGEGHRPSLDFQLKDASGTTISRSVIVENYDQQTDFTMHILKSDYAMPLALYCKAYFDQTDFSAEQTIPVTES
jgi:hypothetical protein